MDTADARQSAGAVRELPPVGAEKFNNLFFYGPRNAGKSCAIDPVTYIFGAKLTHTRPAGKCNFPLQGIVSKKVAVLQDLRPQSMRIGGQHVAVPIPRNVNSEDVTWSAKGMPFFISGSDKLRISTEDAYREGVGVETQNTMMAARFCYFYFPRSRSERDCKRCPPCGSCFSRWLQVCRRHLSLPRRAAHPGPDGQSPGQRRQQQPARKKITPLPAANKQAIVKDLRRSLQLKQEGAELVFFLLAALGLVASVGRLETYPCTRVESNPGDCLTLVRRPTPIPSHHGVVQKPRGRKLVKSLQMCSKKNRLAKGSCLRIEFVWGEAS